MPSSSAKSGAGGRTVSAANAPPSRSLQTPFTAAAVAPGWRHPTVVALARGIYEERAFDRLPVLADALREAGCEDPDVLAHCRGPGPHVRGCWAVDLLLGKE